VLFWGERRVEIESNGRHGNANAQRERSVQLRNSPTQAKTGLEWATGPVQASSRTMPRATD